MGSLNTIKIAGGSSKNSLWNLIRATVLNKPIAVADERELAMAGILYYMMEFKKVKSKKPAINFSITAPDNDLISIYDEKYRRFIQYQKLSELGFKE
jgi:sugar (pentulose or hexulose) kinase